MTVVDLNTVKKIHFIGIGGAGMRAIANIFIEKGYIVSGSDSKQTEITERFARQGARICIGQRPENLADAEAVIVSTAIHPDNAEWQAARERHLPILHRSDALVHIMSWGKAIAVAGAHGKTTTSSMLGQVFIEGRLHPTIVIGGEVDYLHSNSTLGTGPYVIAEADESDGTFLKEHPAIAVVTNIDADHMDHYGSMAHVIAAFKQFIQRLDPQDGVAVLCFDNEHIRRLASQVGRTYISYGFAEDAEYTAKNLHYKEGKHYFDVYRRQVLLGTVCLQVPGRHNVLNALATIAVSLHCGLPFAEIAAALCRFHGAKRRFQTKGYVGTIRVVDDYAHHPTEIKATLAAAGDMGTHRVVCLFQPHRYSRTQLLLEQFGTAFSNADILVVTDIYGADEDPVPGVTGRLIVDKIKEKTGKSAVYIPHKEDILPFLQKEARPHDLILTMGAGDIYRIGEAYITMAKGERM